MASEAPKGVFGWVHPISVTHGDGKITPKALGHLFFEVHKTHEGAIHIVGFVNPDIAAVLRRELTDNVRKVTLYTDGWDRASEIISIPINRVKPERDPRMIKFDASPSVVALDVTVVSSK